MEMMTETYEKDDGALSPDQIESIRALSTATNIQEDSFTEKLFHGMES